MLGCRALRAEAVDFHSVLNLGEAVGLGDRGCPAFNGRGFNLHCFATVAAQQVVVVACGGAAPVERFSLAITQRVHHTLISHGGQDAVCGGQRNPDVLLVQQTVQHLRADKVVQRVQGSVDGHALFGDALLLHRCIVHGWTHFLRGLYPINQPSAPSRETALAQFPTQFLSQIRVQFLGGAGCAA